MKICSKLRESFLWHSFWKDKVAIICAFILLILMSCAFLAPWIAPTNPYDQASFDLMNSELPPAWMQGGEKQFLLGTDTQGRDLLSTILYGMRTSVMIGLGAVALQAALGISLGLVSGYVGGKLDSLIMRIADVQLSFSTMMVAIILSSLVQAIFGLESYNDIAIPLLICIIGFAEWPQYARTIRASVLAEKKKEYVEAAKVVGLSCNRIMWRHILPNTLSPLLVVSTVQVANAIMSEAALSFLGLGMPVTKPSLGSLIKMGFEFFSSGQLLWIVVFPGIVLVLLVLVINLLGDWLRDVLNPKLYKR